MKTFISNFILIAGFPIRLVLALMFSIVLILAGLTSYSHPEDVSDGLSQMMDFVMYNHGAGR